MNAIIIDDEPLAQKVILQYADDLPFLNIVGQLYMATDAYSILERENIDLIFLDINMPKLKGLDFLKTLNSQPSVIVTTAYEEFALEGFELQVVDYLLKPFRFDRFLKAVNLAKSKMERSTIGSQEKLFIKVDRKQIQVNVKDIQYIESYGNYVKVWFNDYYHLTPRTLSSYELELKDHMIRIHKSYLIQISNVDFIEGNSVVMKNGNQVTVGKNYKSLIKNYFR